MSAEIVTRRRLLHWHQPGYAHFMTYRLAGSIPDFLLRDWRREGAELMRHAGGLIQFTARTILLAAPRRV
jgi:hypothetical protein